MKKLLKNINFRVWLAITGVSTILIGTSYVMVQQSTRLAADDAPIALAEQIQNASNQKDLVDGLPKVNLNNQSGTFAILVDMNKKVIASSADLDGQTPLPPSGVLDYTLKYRQDSITWQPKPHVRLATYVIPLSSPETFATHDVDFGYIITGQSLNNAEDRINTYTRLAAIGWLLVIAWTSLALLYKRR